METFSASLALCAGNSPVTSEFPTPRPVARNFDVFFDLRLNKQLSKQSWGWWFETPSRPLWRHCNAYGIWNLLCAAGYSCNSAYDIFTFQWQVSCRFPMNMPSNWLPKDLTDDKSTSIQLIAWCCQAINHYLNQKINLMASAVPN